MYKISLYTVFLTVIASFCFLCFATTVWGQESTQNLLLSDTQEQDAISTEQRALLDKIEHYLNGIQTMVTEFTQESPEGELSYGMFYLQRPGKFRWQYEAPTPITIVGRDELITYYDKELEEISYVTLEESLTGFLSRASITIPSDDIALLNITSSEREILVSVYQNDRPEEGILTMSFIHTPEVTLSGLQILGPTGQITRVILANHQYDISLDSKLFFISKKSP